MIIACGTVSGTRALPMPAFLKRLTSTIERERLTGNAYIGRVISQRAYSASHLWVWETVVPHIRRHGLFREFIDEAQTYLAGRADPKAASDARYVDRLIAAAAEDTDKVVATVCTRMLARDGFEYLRRFIERERLPQLPERHPHAVPRPVLPDLAADEER